MTQDELAQRLLLTAEIAQHIQLYANEATRAEPTRAWLEAHAGRTLKAAARLYAASLPPARLAADHPTPPLDARTAQIVELWDSRRD
jgi:hypothetical protein